MRSSSLEALVHDNLDSELLQELLGYPCTPNPSRGSESFRHMPCMSPSQGGWHQSSSRPPGHGHRERPTSNECVIKIESLELTNLEKRQVRAMPSEEQDRAVGAESSKFALGISLGNDALIKVLIGPCLKRKPMDALQVSGEKLNLTNNTHRKF